MQIEYDQTQHGTAWKVRIEEKKDDFGLVKRQANGNWGHSWDGIAPWVCGYKTRLDATVALLLQWGGRGGAPKRAEIYKWIVDIEKERAA